MISELLGWLLLVAGGLVGVIGGIGIHRFPGTPRASPTRSVPR